MRLVRGPVRMVWLSLFLGLVSTIAFAGAGSAVALKRARLRAGLDFARGTRKASQRLKLVARQGWCQVGLSGAETSQEHIDGIITLLIEVSTELKLTLRRLQRCVLMIRVHETDEAARGKDRPLIPTSSMPRSKRARKEYLEKEWKPFTRAQEIRRLKQSYEEAKPLIIKWVRANVHEDHQEEWLDLVEEFHLVETEDAVIDFEVHALNEALMAVLLALEDEEEERLEPEVAGAWIQRAERIITLEPLKVRLGFLKETLSELQRENGELAQAEAEEAEVTGN